MQLRQQMRGTEEKMEQVREQTLSEVAMIRGVLRHPTTAGSLLSAHPTSAVSVQSATQQLADSVIQRSNMNAAARDARRGLQSGVANLISDIYSVPSGMRAPELAKVCFCSRATRPVIVLLRYIFVRIGAYLLDAGVCLGEIGYMVGFYA